MPHYLFLQMTGLGQESIEGLSGVSKEQEEEK
jgi:hypothetical protein